MRLQTTMYPMLVTAALAVLTAGVPLARADQPRQTSSFDAGWKFKLGDPSGAQNAQFDDSAWRGLDLPHDFSIEGPPGADPSKMEGPFDPNSPAGAGGGYLNAGTAWYRKTFTLPQTAKGRRVWLQFDGVYMDSTVWLNGKELGTHPYGYTSFGYDLTDHLDFGTGKNLLAVRVVVDQPCSRWYSGAGIYRHVWLTVTDPVHVAPWGTYVTAEPGSKATQVRVRVQARNEGAAPAQVELQTFIVDAAGKAVAHAKATEEIAAGAQWHAGQRIDVDDAHRWSLEDPYLYQAVSELSVGGKVVDRYATPFGVRTIEFTADRGFLLNGKHVAIKGVCDHHDLGCLGSAVFERGIQRQLEMLKSMGCNAIRTSHNPPAPELLDLCDRMGFVVMDEAFDEWKHNKTRNGYGRFFDEWSERDIVSMLHRDRNHPCVVLWSIGNEIPEQGAKNGGEMAARLAGFCHREDPTRPVTSACNNPRGAVKSGYAAALDVFGINYNIGAYKSDKGRPLIGSETSSALSTRGEYGLTLGKNGKVQIKTEFDHQVTSYDLGKPNWGSTGQTDLLALKAAPWVAGEFVWTGFDYIGEPTPYTWPSRSSYFGIIDLAGFPKDRFYLYRSQWTDAPLVHLLPHWNWEEFAGKEIPVWCFTNAESVVLFLNGKSLGEKHWSDAVQLHLEWSVPFAPGTLKAVAKQGGKVVATDIVRTAGKPARIELSADRQKIAASGEDLCFVTARIVNENGVTCPNAAEEISFKVGGPASIAGLDDGDPTNQEPFQGTSHKAFHGLTLAVLRSGHEPGQIAFSASAPGLTPAKITVESVK